MDTNTTTPAAEAPKAPLASIILAILSGADVSKSDFGRASFAFVPTPKDAGPKILTRQGIATAIEIAANEKIAPELRATNTGVIAAHGANLVTIVDSNKVALITILSTPIGASKEDHPELTEAYKELGLLAERLLNRKALPGLARKESDRSQILSGLASDVYAVIKDNHEFADLREAADNRLAAAKNRIAELQTEFEARFPDKTILQRIRMIGLIADVQNDPGSMSREEKKALVTKNGNPIFKGGRLTSEAKDRLNIIGADASNPEWLTKQIRGIFARDAEVDKVNALKTEVGPGL